MKRHLWVVGLAALVLATPAAAQTRGMTSEDYFAFETIGDPHFSPDGSTIAFVVTTVDQKQNRRRSEIWSVPADGSREPMALTTAPQSSNSPRWSPDGKAIAFLSARPVAGDAAADTPRTQVWLLSLGGGEPRRVTGLLNGVTSFQWSPDSSELVVVGRSGPSDTATSPSDVRHYAHASYKFNDTGWFDDKRTDTPLDHRRRVGTLDADHLGAKTGTTRTRSGPRWPQNRLRVRSHRQGVRHWGTTPTSGRSTRAAGR